MAVSISVRNTFFHFEDSQGEGTDEQPSLLRAATQPFYLHRESCSGQLAVTTSKPAGSRLADDAEEAEATSNTRSRCSSTNTADEPIESIVDASKAEDVVNHTDDVPMPCEDPIEAPILLGRMSSCIPRESMGKPSSNKDSKSSGHSVWGLVKPPPADWTTLMVRNLPCKYSRDDFVSLLTEQGFSGRFDFVYYPIDFEKHTALGYAFVNMLSPKDAHSLWERLDGFKKWSRPCNKVCQISWSQPLQGLDANVARYRNSPVMHKLVPDQYRPLLFADGERVAFPPPTKNIKIPRKGNQPMLVPRA